MPLSNPLRSDVPVTVAGRDLIMRPTFEALAAIEGATGRAAYDLLSTFANPRTARLSDMAHIVVCGCQAVDPRTAPTVAEVGADIQKKGIKTFFGPVMAFMVMATMTEEDLAAQKKAVESAGKEKGAAVQTMPTTPPPSDREAAPPGAGA